MEGFFPLASGSKGNCVYVGTQNTKILIDAGISGRRIKEELARLNVKLTDIDAIFVTHEHADHIAGLKVLAYRLGIPIFANHETAKGIVEYFHDCPKFKIFTTGEPFLLGDLEVHPFSIQHDTIDPVGFTIKTDQLKLGFCTDLGFVTSLVRHQLQNCDYLYVEANHQPSMVYASSRPMIYKQRVLSRSGHLSNEACAELLSDIAHERLKHVHLAHLSSECNTPETALQVIKGFLQNQGIKLEISIAPQHTIGKPIYFSESAELALNGLHESLLV
ncbi:MBL fold metallo-hydrolase [Parachlamydia sp. AcF125]|uniref:MBL fold metallo-hydrolase n=1 Tax=Parachlamydia sp. AcF125 TaxID=2795736 RepID=UPI001BCA3B4E|nr:MBL fold metallo-hydrolase [Parachlamydia sp. AcF125]MBS4167554.1 putative metallo-hydrolase YycJ [Parachlamydia sp. AcF125]